MICCAPVLFWRCHAHEGLGAKESKKYPEAWQGSGRQEHARPLGDPRGRLRGKLSDYKQIIAEATEPE
jgi:hypothetical protein